MNDEEYKLFMDAVDTVCENCVLNDNEADTYPCGNCPVRISVEAYHEEKCEDYDKNLILKVLDHTGIKNRCHMAEDGLLLEFLINDWSSQVREKVAEQGYGLDKLINDQDARVRCAVARQNYGLDRLINDESWQVRWELAGMNYRLDKLVNDPCWQVRQKVCCQGYGLDILVNDEDRRVSASAKSMLAKNLRNTGG